MRKVKHYFGRCRSKRGKKYSWPRWLYGPTILYFEPSPEFKAIAESWVVENRYPEGAFIDHTIDAIGMARDIDVMYTYPTPEPENIQILGRMKSTLPIDDQDDDIKIAFTKRQIRDRIVMPDEKDAE